jgi:hypothetical protein
MRAHSFNPDLSAPEPIARAVATGARLVMALIFVVNGLGNLTSEPLALIEIAKLTVGVMLMSKRLVPVALALSAPITVDLMAHAVRTPSGIGHVLLILELGLYLAWQFRDAFRARTAPAPMVAPAPILVPQSRPRRTSAAPATARPRSWFLA